MFKSNQAMLPKLLQPGLKRHRGICAIAPNAARALGFYVLPSCEHGYSDIRGDDWLEGVGGALSTKLTWAKAEVWLRVSLLPDAAILSLPDTEGSARDGSALGWHQGRRSKQVGKEHRSVERLLAPGEGSLSVSGAIGQPRAPCPFRQVSFPLGWSRRIPGARRTICGKGIGQCQSPLYAAMTKSEKGM
eukprot:CAMPEP_0177607884 /NCGR_PEP_ID=MMETSP0419_2-20121207/18164_1 /TAXON_ID=582737 /ORGANISM="Tetraselmis sp., Strain GSL018" /LENGTH=188 /DNA_ID=CAMNT_0019102513 /DNA_START=76 /DNA_END=643 /DNA_ORIENTATION=-